MERGLAAPLSPNEVATLWRVQAATKLADLDKRHIHRLTSLQLISLDGDAVSLTVLGKRRLEDSLPLARAVAQKQREAELLGLLGRPADFLALLDETPQKQTKPQKLAPKAQPKTGTASA